MYMYVCMHVCTSSSGARNMNIMTLCMYMYNVCMHVCTSSSGARNMNIMTLCMYMYVCIHVCTCMYVCMYVHHPLELEI